MTGWKGLSPPSAVASGAGNTDVAQLALDGACGCPLTMALLASCSFFCVVDHTPNLANLSSPR
jgi:hypothetical protein